MLKKKPIPRPKEEDLTPTQLRRKYRVMIQNKLNSMDKKDRLSFLTKELKNLGTFKIED
mgnify:FL=1